MGIYLVTGAAGFIGRWIAAALLAQGKTVRGLDDFSTGKRENLVGLEGIEFIEGDIRDAELMRKACEGVEVVFHEAALASVPRSVENPVLSNDVNVTGTLNVLVAARDAGVRRVLFAGSSSVYGNVPTLPKHEEMAPQPISPYAVAKLAGEAYMKSFWQVYGLETVVLRYFNVFGPNQDPNSMYSGVLARFTSRMLAGEDVTIHGDGEQSRDFTFIDNVVRGNLLAAEADAAKVAGRSFNVATGTRIDLNSTAALLRELTGFKGNISHGPERSGDVKHSLADISQARDAFSYSPIVDFKEGLRRTVAWYRESAVTAS
jgi:UDP-glucose 4-epimerase